MLEASQLAWLLLAFCLLMYSTATIKISRLLPWCERSSEINLPTLSGLAMAPFLLGMTAILALGLFPSANHNTHLAIILVAPLLSFLLKTPAQNFVTPQSKIEYAFDEKLALLLLIAAAFALLLNALFFPLTQNDSLEYATVGRTLFETRNLMDYSVLSPEKNTTGFYAPWTHPPLYVSLIYVTYLLQAQDLAPGLMRIISPWFTLLSMLITYAIGAFIKRRLGLFAAILLISTPLLFLGTDSGLIDPLPMLGLLLIFISLIGIKTNPVKSGLIQGGALGLALWTHSQAILFIPITIVMYLLMNNEKDASHHLKQLGALLLSSLVIAFLPYAHNFQLFGVLISDNNPIYALPSLHWADYFKYARELNSITAIIQYGIFKGWFMLEYYGITFWLMSLSLVIYCYRISPFSSNKRNWLEPPAHAYPDVLLIASGIILVYLAGMVLSVLLGIDLMIRNERYLLVIVPYVSLLAAWLYTECIESKLNKNFTRNFFARMCSISLIAFLPCLLSLQLFTFVKYRFTNNHTTPSNLFSSQSEKLLNFPNMLAMNYLNLHSPKKAIVLSTQPADMYYAHRKMVSYLDPRLIPFYSSKDPKEAADLLKNLGVSYIHVTDYSLPIFYNSVLMETLADPSLSVLLYSIGANQLYRLGKDTYHYQSRKNVGPSFIPWVQYKQYVFMQNKTLIPNTSNPFLPLENKSLSHSNSMLNLFQRNFSTTLMSEKGIKVASGNEYVIDFLLSGDGYLDFFILQLDKSGAPIKSSNNHASYRMLVGNLVLNNTQGRFIRRIKLLPDTHSIQIGIEQHGNSSIIIEHAQLIELKRELEK